MLTVTPVADQCVNCFRGKVRVAANVPDRVLCLSRGRIRDKRGGRFTVRIFVYRAARGARVIHCSCHCFVCCERVCAEQCRQCHGEPALRIEEQPGLQQNRSIEQQSDSDQVLHHQGRWRSCALSDGRATGRKPIFQDNVGAGYDADSAAWGSNCQGTVCARQQGKRVLGEHRYQQ